MHPRRVDGHVTAVYEVEGEKLRCRRHDQLFGATDSCTGCDADPGPPLEQVEEKLDKPPSGCRSTEQHERWFTALAEDIDKMRRELSRKGKGIVRDLHHYNSIAKLAETAIKARRAAADITVHREDAEIQRARELRDRKQQGLGGHH
jgi:hypothetical protein